VYSGGADQPCLAGDICNTGFCVEATSCPNGLGKCCKTASNCTGDGSCADPNRICAFASVCGSGPTANSSQCCAPFGGLNQACAADNSCSDSLVCIQDPAVCPSGLQACCMDPGSLGQPCLPGDVCDAGMDCVSVVTATVTPAKRCVKAGGLLERCHANNTCDTGLTCLGDFSAGTSGQCQDSLFTCCRQVPTGAMSQPCGANDTCDGGLTCTQGYGACQYPEVTRCCQHA
jgi:hypothetical protein